MDQGKKLVGLALYMIMLGMLIAGSANTIIMKIQNLSPGEQSPDLPKKFNHPYFYCAVIFIGELLCLVAYGVKELYKWRQKKRELVLMVDTAEEYKQGSIPLKTKINPLLLAIPASFDIIASTLMNIALTMVAASVY